MNASEHMREAVKFLSSNTQDFIEVISTVVIPATLVYS